MKNKERLIEIADNILHFLIFVNLVIICLETFDTLSYLLWFFELAEDVTVFVFTVEYIIRCYLAYKHGRLWKYVFSALGIIDLISILPFYIPFSDPFDTRFVKLLRLFRLFTLFKLYRYSDHLKTIVDVLKAKSSDLIATLFSIFVVLMFCSYLMYYIEHDVQPDKFANIFDAFWWGISTLGTIGYGDVYPVTIGGKLIASFLALLGVGLIAIPSAILSAGFVEVQNKKKQNHEKKQENEK
ncbi:MAG: ion transporter [Cytophagales bacterium]